MKSRVQYPPPRPTIMTPTPPPTQPGTWEFHYAGNLRTTGLLVTRRYKVNSSCMANAIATSAGYALHDFGDPRLVEMPRRVAKRVAAREREAYKART